MKSLKTRGEPVWGTVAPHILPRLAHEEGHEIREGRVADEVKALRVVEPHFGGHKADGAGKGVVGVWTGYCVHPEEGDTDGLRLRGRGGTLLSVFEFGGDGGLRGGFDGKRVHELESIAAFYHPHLIAVGVGHRLRFAGGETRYRQNTVKHDQRSGWIKRN